MSGPSTSVIIPVLNGEDFILAALASVLRQLDAHDEVIVIDDGSTDGTRRLLDGCDARVRVIETAGRRGPSTSRNAGLAAARGGYIAFLDHDDLWPAGRHAALSGLLGADETVDAVAGRIRIRAEHNGAADSYRELDGRHAPAMLGSCLYRRSLIDRTGLFDEDMRFGEDLNYHVRLAESGMKLVTCDHDALVYRRHARNVTNAAPPHNATLMNILARKLARSRRA
jgi:glycosyltransferase involved in cell wall biosynthesis